MRLKIFSLTLALLLVSSVALAATITGKVVKVSDGDTIQVLHNGSPVKIRFQGIDCPETSGQAFGMKAKAFVLDLVAGKTVQVHISDTDRYGRSLGEVFLLDGRSLNQMLVKEGLAWHYRQYSKDPRLAALEAEARRDRRGLWVDKNPMPPWDYRRLTK